MIGGQTFESALEPLTDQTQDLTLIGPETFRQRLARLQQSIKDNGGGAVYLHGGTNLLYFTGLRWSPSERMVAAVVPAEGELQYISPKFEIDTLQDYWQIPGTIHSWEEHESPYQLLANVVQSAKLTTDCLYLDEFTPFLFSAPIAAALPRFKIAEARQLTVPIRSRKTQQEIAIIQRAHEITLQVQRSTASILKPGISTTEVVKFIDQAHRKLGAPAGSSFCIVLFGKATSFPHGVKDPQVLQENDWVLVDTGCLIDGYNSDITRSYAFGTPTDQQRSAWQAERAAQLAAFEAAELGKSCEVCDAAARASLEAAGYGPDYQLPGLPHRTGHGCGLDIHESPNLVRGETTPLAPGMVFSNEPMLVIPDQFGVRLEDHFYMSENGPVWLTQPAESLENPI